MMKMVSMRNPKPDRTEKAESPCCSEYYEEFPYGTTVTLDSGSTPSLIEKLPVLASVVAGQEIDMICKVRVKRVESSERDEKDGKKLIRRIELQITDLAMSSDDGLDEEFEQASNNG